MARLQKRAEQDRQQIEALTQGELKKLAENLRQCGGATSVRFLN